MGRLVQGLDLVDEQQLVVAGHGHAQDQLQEPGHVLHRKTRVHLRSTSGRNVGDGQIVPSDTFLTEIVSVVVEDHVEQNPESLDVGLLRLENTREPGWSECCGLYLDQNFGHCQSITELCCCARLKMEGD